MDQAGRPSKYTPELVDRILKYIASGVSKTQAAIINGIHRDTLREWELKYSEFAEAVQKAEAERSASLIIGIRAAGEKDWRALAWLLERFEPKRFNLAQRIEQEGEVTQNVRMTPAEARYMGEFLIRTANERENKQNDPNHPQSI